MRADADSDDPFQNLTPAERVRVVARTLATGVLRMRDRAVATTAALPVEIPSNSSESGPNRLELLGDTVLSVHRG